MSWEMREYVTGIVILVILVVVGAIDRTIYLLTLVQDHVPQDPHTPSSIIKFKSKAPDRGSGSVRGCVSGVLKGVREREGK